MRISTIIGVYLLVGLVIGQTLTAPVVWLRFMMQQEYIAQTLCEKRAEPIAVCYGSCVLRKELRKATEPESPYASAPVKVKISVLFYVASQDCFSRFDLLPKTLTFYPERVGQLLLPHLNDLFIPPRG